MEEHFKNKLKNHKVDWDKEALLGNLEQKLSPNKSRFDWKWFLLLPLLLLVTCWGWNTLQRSTDNTASTQIENNSVLIEKENKIAKNVPVNENETAVMRSSRDENNLEKSQHSSNLIKQPNKRKAELIQSASEIKEVQSTDILKKNAKPNLELNTANLADLSKTRSPISREQSIKYPNLVEENKSELPKNVLDIQTAKEMADNVALIVDDLKKDVLPLDPIPVLEWKELDLIAAPENLPDLSNLDIDPKKDNISAKNPFYISGSGEIGLVYRSRMFNTTNPEYVNRLENNEATENSLFVISTNLYIGYQNTSRWSLQTGLEYNEIKEVFNYNESTSETISVEKILYPIINGTDTSYVLTTTMINRTEERTVKHYNKHIFYSVPIQIGYRFDLKKAKLITRLGCSYTFSHNFKGKVNYIYENEGNEILDSNSEFGFELKNRIGLQAGLALEYPFLKQGQFFATATYRRSPRLTSGFIEQNYHSLSLGLGFKFSFGSND